MTDLQGSLAILSLPGLLQLLSTEGRTGRLHLDSAAPAPRGSVWLDDGRIVHAELADAAVAAGEEAVHALLAGEAGTFRFQSGDRAPQRTVDATTGQLLMEAACRRDHAGRDDSAGFDPSVVPVISLVPATGSTPRFNTMQWRVLASVDGRRDTSTLAAEVGLPVATVAGLIEELILAGVLELR